MELWDEELKADVHAVGIYTMPEMELPFGEMEPLVEEIERVAYEVVGRGKFLVSIGGEHSITPPLVSAAARKYPGLSVLQIDAHADMRDAYMGTRHSHACAMRRVARVRAADAGRHPQLVHRRSRGAAAPEYDRCSTTSTCAAIRSGSTPWWTRSSRTYT